MGSSLHLTFVGSGDAFSSGGRLQSGILLATRDQGLLLDCGVTLLTGLQACNLTSEQIDRILVSHLHGDHFGGIPFLLLDALFVQKRCKPLNIFGPAGLEERIAETCHNFYPGALDGPLPFVVNYHVLTPSETTVAESLQISTFSAHHGQHAAACSLRIELAGRIIAYSGDTEWHPGLVDLANGSDLFICECCTYDNHLPGHLDYLTLCRHLGEFDTQRLILTHLGPQIDAHREKIDLEIAHDGLQIQL
jgi:ribonuclease BN (tRNA processing enzyme)